MSIAFNQTRWAEVRRNWNTWWRGELGRPLIYATVGGRDPGRPEPALPYRHFMSHYSLDVTPEAIIDRYDYNLQTQEYLADAFPHAWLNFGPGVAAAFLGCELHNGENTTWYHPVEAREVADLRLAYKPDNLWLERIKAIGRAAQQRWGGLVQIGQTDLGGTLDILSSFRPGEELLLDLYDNPEAVKRLVWEIHEHWFKYFSEINEAMRPSNPGYSSWSTLYSEKPGYMLQCDFSYMIGPEMFAEFVLPELAAACRRMEYPFYHLDGVGELPHLDMLLSIPELRGIQWVPGAGQKDADQWPEVYRRIRAAGKLIWVAAGQSSLGLDLLDCLADQLGSAEGIYFICGASAAERGRLERLLEKYNAPVMA